MRIELINERANVIERKNIALCFHCANEYSSICNTTYLESIVNGLNLNLILI